MEIERRFISSEVAGIEVRASEDGKFGIRGLGAVIGAFSEDLGGFKERNAEGAFDEAIKVSDIRGLFNHDPNYVLGRMGRTMRVSADARGMHYDIPELPASRADVREAIERRDVEGSSYSFTLREGGDRWDEEDNMLVRTILPGGVARIYDLGPVTFPAFRATTVAKRCAEMVRDAFGADEAWRATHAHRRRRMDLIEAVMK
jgi:hypothetical protein